MARKLSEKQKVALEFLGHSTEGLTREDASALLDAGFHSPDFDSAGYEEFIWQQRHRLYSPRQILEQKLRRLQNKEFLVSERLSSALVNQALEQAKAEGINEDMLFEFIKARFPKAILADSTRRKKLSEARSSAAYMREFSDYMKASVYVGSEQSGKRKKWKLAIWAALLVTATALVWWVVTNYRIEIMF